MPTFLRSLTPAICALAVLALPATGTAAPTGAMTGAPTEKHVFFIATDSDGYGVDHCLASGARCGAAMATAYCQSKAFREASSYHRVDGQKIASDAEARSPRAHCHGANCMDLVAIECAR